MDGLSPYKSNGIFDRRWAGECRPQSGDEKVKSRGGEYGRKGKRETERERERNRAGKGSPSRWRL